MHIFFARKRFLLFTAAQNYLFRLRPESIMTQTATQTWKASNGAGEDTAHSLRGFSLRVDGCLTEMTLQILVCCGIIIILKNVVVPYSLSQWYNGQYNTVAGGCVVVPYSLSQWYNLARMKRYGVSVVVPYSLSQWYNRGSNPPDR